MKPITEQMRVRREQALAAFLRANGQRVRRATAMQLLCIESEQTFKKVVDANPGLVHRLKGETQPKYVTAEIFRLLPISAWCATDGEDGQRDDASRIGVGPKHP